MSSTMPLSAMSPHILRMPFGCYVGRLPLNLAIEVRGRGAESPWQVIGNMSCLLGRERNCTCL